MAVAAVALVLASVLPASSSDEEKRAESQLVGTLSDDRARIYPVSRDELWTALTAVLAEHRFRFATRDDSNGVLITRFRLMSGKHLPGLAELARGADFEPGKAQLHLFVPLAEPGRLHVGSMVEGWVTYTESRMFFNVEYLDRWLFERLETRLGVAGHEIPSRLEDRLQLAERLRPGSVPARCMELDETLDPSESTATAPQVIQKSKVTPLFPYSLATADREASVLVRAAVREDGAVSDSAVFHGTAAPQWFRISAIRAVAFWRFQPAMQAGCPVPAYADVLVVYEQP